VLEPERARLVAFATPAMESLHQQLASPTLTVLLADREGFILSVVGPHALLPGAPADHASNGHDHAAAAPVGGGSSLGTITEHAVALIAGRRVVLGVTAPILAPDGGILGILDFCASPFDNLSHASALLQTTAGIIEHRLIESDERGFLVLRFHPRVGVLGGPLEALAVFDRESRLLATNQVANNLLALGSRRSGLRCPDCFDAHWPGLVGQAALAMTEPFVIRACRGTQFYARAALRHPPADS
jgi:transcriptional regulator of acetoin/glycerol metabolism